MLGAKFGETEKTFKFLSSVKCEVELEYSASVGYDREEEYEEYNSVSKQYETCLSGFEIECRSTLPGDRYKDFSSSGKVKPFVLSLAAFAAYEVLYKVIKDKNFGSAKETKINNLKKIFAQKGFADLTSDELSAVEEGMSKSKKKFVRFSKTKQGKIYTVFKWLSIFMFVFCVLSFFSGVMMNCAV